MGTYRTHHCSELRPEHAGQRATLAGWVATKRDHHGVIFIDLRDRDGVTQVVFRPEQNPEAAKLSHGLRSEDVISVSGVVETRSEATVNPNLATGRIELVADALTILNKSEVPPFPLDDPSVNEDLRLQYRYLDLRTPTMHANLRLRHKVTKAVRDYFDSQGFFEIETPILSNPTPEGARDFLVPSRLHPGDFYALPQAPQQYKQLLQVGGLEKYFQIAKCFRDEDLRADRQPEFTQIDVEASFVGQEDIIALCEGMLRRIWKDAQGIEIPEKFPRMTYREAMDRYGSDKPDIRFGLELVDLTQDFLSSDFKVFRGIAESGGVIRALNAKGAAPLLSREQLKKWEEWAKSEFRAKGLAYIKWAPGGEWDSPIVKFFGEAEKKAIVEKLNFAEGDIVFFGADKRDAASEVLGRVRLRVAEVLGLIKAAGDRLAFLWVVDFPLLAYLPEEHCWTAVHHPFTRPNADDVPKMERGEYEDLRAVAYDVVLNGIELGGGSIRIHERDLQAKMFAALGIGPEEQQRKFGHILKAFSFGAPPHGGIALGLDRLVMLMAQADSIREVMAFPKNNRGMDLMSGAPLEVEPKSLRDLQIAVTKRA
ncbi:MAG: aspartate--tRNA ligase [Verrucomicrobia bacterium]|nr:aspartate--tRNA ligase [Verrucomicrobiota bacterium]